MDIMTAKVKDRLDREQRRVCCVRCGNGRRVVRIFNLQIHTHFFNKIDIHTTQLASTVEDGTCRESGSTCDKD